eukprot:GHVN01018060.1.p1 GENE.GHVN01018060.1~~GHVN01018060.1.p1  ORF type:complete len:381 (-),score=36.51 GHVN01018060.1:1059-2201(-)
MSHFKQAKSMPHPETIFAKSQKMTAQFLKERARAAMLASLAGDALAMPVHWHYDKRDIYAKYGPSGIVAFHDAPDSFKGQNFLHSLIKNDSAIRSVIGPVILRGKDKEWETPGMFYHKGLKAGDTTLGALVARVALRSLTVEDEKVGEFKGIAYDVDTFLKSYKDFMTADPPQHQDSFADAEHRDFFVNLVKGNPLNECATTKPHANSVSGLKSIPFVVLPFLVRGYPLQEVQQIAKKHLNTMYQIEELTKAMLEYVELISRLLINELGVEAAKKIVAEYAVKNYDIDLTTITEDELLKKCKISCHISDGFPIVIYLVYKYADDPKQAIIVNANLGGDNVHRGSMVGLLTALCAQKGIPDLAAKLTDKVAIDEEIERVLS